MIQFNEFISRISKGTYKQVSVQSNFVGVNRVQEFSSEGKETLTGKILIWTEYQTTAPNGSIIGHMVFNVQVKS